MSSTKKNITQFTFALMVIFLPNLLFLIIALETDTARPIINSDYTIVAFFICLSLLSWPISKIVAIAIFSLTTISESLLFTMQVFPIKGIGDLLYLAPFLLNAPVSYIAIAFFIVIYIFIAPIILFYLSKKSSPVHMLFACIFLVIIGITVGSTKYKELYFEGATTFARKNFYYINTQLGLYSENSKQPFLIEANKKPNFTPSTTSGATQQISKKAIPSNKTILIIAESYGSPSHPDIQDEITKKLVDNNNFSFFETGKVSFKGLTVQAEMRELCNKYVEGFSLKKSSTEDYTDCIINEKNKQGFTTIALHGSSSLLYDRYDWYKKAGFKKTIFSENLPELKRCQTFNGICDSELLPLIKDKFQENDKTFFYWLTLTGHYPYPIDDIYNQRFDCNKYGIKNEMVCRNLKIQTQFMDEVAELSSSEEMKGVEFIIVGDHLPPIFDREAKHKFFKEEAVPWIHFIVNK